MVITALRIQNFKCWKDTDEFQLAPITGFFGVNSSGKTSLLQFLLLLKQTIGSSDTKQILNFGGSDKELVDLGGGSDVLYRAKRGKSANNLSWMLQWNLAAPYESHDIGFALDRPFYSAQMRFSASVKREVVSDLRSLYISEFHYEITDALSSFHYRLGMRRNRDRAYHLTETGSAEFYANLQEQSFDPPTRFYGFPVDRRMYFRSTPPPVTFEMGLEEAFANVYYLGPLRDYPRREYAWGGASPSDVGKRGENTIPALIASRLRKTERGETVEQKVAEWLKRLGLIHNFKIEEIARRTNLYTARVQQSSETPFVPITDVGFGVSQILPVLTLCYYAPRNSILILEQPEIHLHPSVQSELADVFVEVARERKLQIILESHSEHLLRRLQRRIAEKNVSCEDVQLYFCERNMSEARLKPLNVNNFGYITNWPRNFFGDEMGEQTAMMEAALLRQENGEAA